MWTFESSYTGIRWAKSDQQFNSASEASLAAAEWMEVNAINDTIVTVRLLKI
jgi:hypothetical protein